MKKNKQNLSNRLIQRSHFICICLCSLLVLGCGNETPQSETPLDLEIDFKVNVGNEPFRCGINYEGIGITQSSVAFTDLRFYVHNILLINSRGEEIPLTLEQDEVWQLGDVALLDFEDGCENGNSALNSKIIGQVPSGEYSGLKFTIGLPAELNSPETVLEGRGSPLNLSAMFWSWRSGYKYLRLDTDLPFFRVHLGANACDDDFNCEEPNLATFEFNDFNAQAQQVSLDLKTLLQESDLTQNTEDTAPGCMGQSDDPDCQRIFKYFNLGEGSSSSFSLQNL